MKKLMAGSASARNAPMMSRTIDIKPLNEETNIVDRINEFSAMDQYAGNTNRQPFDIDKVDKKVLLPSIAQFQSDDSLFGESKTNLGESKMVIPHQKQQSHEQTGFELTQMTAP